MSEIWIENLVLYNKLIQAQGQDLNVIGSYTDSEGDTLISVDSKLSSENQKIYDKIRLEK